MLNKVLASFLPILSVIWIAPFSSTLAQPARDLNDEKLTTFEVQQEKTVDGYGTTQDSTIAFFEEAESKRKSLANGSSASPASLNDEQLNYLSGVYLHCAMKNSACPIILDAILEIDVMNSKLSGKNDCKNMLGFWNRWVKNEFEKRLNYSLQKGLARYLEFKTKEMPRYVKCSKTIERETKSESGSVEYFKKRYGLDAPNSNHLSKLAKYLQIVKQKIPDVFVATGALKE